MNFTSKAKDFHATVKTESTLKLQDLDFVVEELEDEAVALISGGRKRQALAKPTPTYKLDSVYASLGG